MSEFKSYSQYGEDTVLKNLIGNNGYFLEIGSYHPYIFSNTRFLVERGWCGCYVDGSSSAIERFIEEYKNNNNIQIVNSLIGDKNDLIEFYDSIGDGISTTDIKHKNMWESTGSPFRKIYSNMINFDKLLSVLPETVDFINIDVEGQSAYLATLIDYNKVNTKVVCIEHDNAIEYLINHMKNYNFEYFWSNSCNIIFKK